ncbi:MAG: hypothetical protein QOI71_990, partial [Gaiellales bacterium]|jgi:hypothetical protein|nr:hypothetical protein [Gaiellales bacterium]
VIAGGRPAPQPARRPLDRLLRRPAPAHEPDFAPLHS